jgi:hypothetical protein
MADEKPGGEINYVKEAFHLQYNWIALCGAAAFAAVSGSALPILLAAGAELMYLAVVPQNGRFQRLVRSWKYAEEKKKHEQKLTDLFHELPPAMRTRYADLDRTCQAIRANYQRLSSTSRIFVDQMEDKLQGLVQSYLRLLHSAFQHREYLRTTDPAAIQREAVELEKELASESAKVQEINRKRVEILKKRLEKYEKIRENCQVVDAQCAAIEDVLELIRDQSVTMRDPQQVSDHLENLMRDVEQTEETVREVETMMTVPEMPGTMAPIPTGDDTGRAPARNRVRN